MTSVPYIAVPAERFGSTSRPLVRTDASAVVDLMHVYETVFLGRPLGIWHWVLPAAPALIASVA